MIVRALKWLWDIGLPIYLCLACLVAGIASIAKGDPAHVSLAYGLGLVCFADLLTDELAKRERGRR